MELMKEEGRRKKEEGELVGQITRLNEGRRKKEEGRRRIGGANNPSQ